jgi:hypothetical protein
MGVVFFTVETNVEQPQNKWYFSTQWVLSYISTVIIFVENIEIIDKT